MWAAVFILDVVARRRRTQLDRRGSRQQRGPATQIPAGLSLRFSSGCGIATPEKVEGWAPRFHSFCRKEAWAEILVRPHLPFWLDSGPMSWDGQFSCPVTIFLLFHSCFLSPSNGHLQDTPGSIPPLSCAPLGPQPSPGWILSFGQCPTLIWQLGFLKGAQLY